MAYKKLHETIEPDQSAVIPYRSREGVIEVLLITTKGKGKWIVPKGGIESDLESHESAEKEALEEAGVKGDVSRVSLGCYRHGNSKKSPIVEVFLMRVESELRSWPEDDERKRRWIPLDEAYQHVEEDGLRSVLDDAIAVMKLSMGTNGFHPAMPTDWEEQDEGG